jgi:hypothetical protein
VRSPFLRFLSVVKTEELLSSYAIACSSYGTSGCGHLKGKLARKKVFTTVKHMSSEKAGKNVK